MCVTQKEPREAIRGGRHTQKAEPEVQLVRSQLSWRPEIIDYDFCQIAFNFVRASRLGGWQAGLLCILALPQAFVSLNLQDLLPPSSAPPRSRSVGECTANVTHAFQFEFTIFLASDAGMRLCMCIACQALHICLGRPLSLPLSSSVCHLHTLHLSEFNLFSPLSPSIFPSPVYVYWLPWASRKMCVYLLYGFLMSSIVSESFHISSLCHPERSSLPCYSGSLVYFIKILIAFWKMFCQCVDTSM